MRGFLVLLALVIAAAVFWPKRRERAAESAASEPVAVVPAVPRVVPAPVAPPAPSAPVTAKDKAPEIDPYSVDRFSRRDLTKPKPASVRELLAKLTPYAHPRLPAVRPGDEEDGDGDVLTTFEGLYRFPDGELKPIEIARNTGGVTVLFPDPAGHERRFFNDEMKSSNFDGDSYSLVLRLPTRVVIYLKFVAAADVPEFGRKARAMVGWLISKDAAMPLAVIDRADRDPDPTESLKRLLPAGLPVE